MNKTDTINYHSRLNPKRYMFFLKNICWSTLSGLVRFLFASSTLAHSLNSRSTSTLVAAGVRNLDARATLEI